MTTTVTIDCSSLSVSNIVIADNVANPYMLMYDGLGRPAITWRLTSAPDSQDVHGSEYLAAVKEQTTLPLRVMIQGASAAALDTALTALENALSQFSYTTTVAVDGVSKVWSCGPAAYSPSSGLVDPAMVAAHRDVYTITIPVYPVSA